MMAAGFSLTGLREVRAILTASQAISRADALAARRGSDDLEGRWERVRSQRAVETLSRAGGLIDPFLSGARAD
jgi:hypothetical protein